jgi:predicted O-methyltransferase YrrM
MNGAVFDLVFIDGDRSPRGCREEWDVWYPHVRVGGVVAFHDAGPRHPGRDRQAWPDRGRQLAPGPAAVRWDLVAEVDSLVVAQRSR